MLVSMLCCCCWYTGTVAVTGPSLRLRTHAPRRGDTETWKGNQSTAAQVHNVAHGVRVRVRGSPASEPASEMREQGEQQQQIRISGLVGYTDGSSACSTTCQLVAAERLDPYTTQPRWGPAYPHTQRKTKSVQMQSTRKLSATASASGESAKFFSSVRHCDDIFQLTMLITLARLW